MLYFTLFVLEKGYVKSTKRQIIPGKNFENLEKSWKNHGILLVSRSGNPGGGKIVVSTKISERRRCCSNVSDSTAGANFRDLNITKLKSFVFLLQRGIPTK